MQENTSSFLRRLILVLLLVFTVFGLYLWRIGALQIEQGEYYENIKNEGYTVTVPISAARGEIVDCYGRALAVNRQGYALVFDRAYMTRATMDAIILDTVQMLEAQGESWTDALPITRTEPFAFIEGADNAKAAILRKFRLNTWATAQNVLDAMADEYRIDVEQFTPDELRLILSVRYSMDLFGFSVKAPYTIATDISMETVMLVEELHFRLPGVRVEEIAIRDYVSGEIAPHVIGQVSPIYAEEYAELKEKGYAMDDTIGRSGIEAAYEEQLRGVDGEKVLTFDANGVLISEEITREPVPGNTVFLTIDSELQRYAQEALGRRIGEIQVAAQNAATEEEPNQPGFDACAGAIVIEDVKNGGLLACVTWPGYDLSSYYQDYSTLVNDPLNPLWNRALYGTYAPGSTFKPAVTVAAVAEGLMTRNKTVYCGGIYTYYEDYQPTCMGIHENTNLVDALCVSCNVYYYEVGRLLGIDTISHYAHALGLGMKTGVEIGEASGRIASPEFKASMNQLWNPGDVIAAAIGQSDTEVTPVQLASYTTTLANNGIRYRSHLVSSVRSNDLQTMVYAVEPEVLADLTEFERAFDNTRSGMVASANRGTVMSWFADYPVTVAAKTGTPQTGQAEKSNNASFIAYAPAEDPEIAISIVIERGGHGYYLAALMEEIMDYYFALHADDSELPNVIIR